MKDSIINVIKAYLLNNQINLDECCPEILNIAKEQALLPMLYSVTKDDRLKKYYIASCIALEKFRKIKEEVTNLFNQNQISHIYFKGIELGDIYPDSVIRTRGDIDVYVEENTIPLVIKILEKNEYKRINGDCMHHVSFEKNGLEIEIHFSMFDEESRFLKHFKMPFTLALKKESYLYKFSDTEHFLYCLCHFYNHLVSGCGIRFVLDFYYMLQKYDLDFDYIHKFIKNYDLFVLYNNILNTIYYLTGVKFDNLEIIDIDFFIDYLLKSGIHGFENDDRFKNRSINKENKLKYALCRLFMTNKQYRISIYPTMGKHLILYPICFIHHLFYLIIFKTKKAFVLFFKGSKSSKEEKEYFKKLGL
ncbi:MAG: nucleotidyltransferase family protein [Anaeroplasma sp.]